MPIINIKDAHDLSDGITFDDTLGIFYGATTPDLADTLNVPDGSMYLQISGSIWHKANGLWSVLGSGGGSGSGHTHPNLTTLNSITEVFTPALKALYDSYQTTKADTSHTHVVGDITDFYAVLNTAISGKSDIGHLHTVSDLSDFYTVLSNALSTVSPINHTHLEHTYLYDKRPKGSDGTDLEKESWNPRTILEAVSPTNIITLQGDDFVVSKAGLYSINCVAKGSGCLRLMNEITDTEALGGICSDEDSEVSYLVGHFYCNAGDIIEIQHWVEDDIELESTETSDYEYYLQAEVIYHGS